MGGGGGVDKHWPPKCSSLVLRVAFAVLVAAAVVTAQTLTDPCATNAALPKDVTVGFSTNLCKLVWTQKSFTVRYASNASTLSIVLSAARENRWYAIGFSKSGAMVGSSAMIAWVDATTGAATIKQFFLGAKSSSGVKIDSQMKLASTPQAFVTSDTMYMAFQIDKLASTGVFFDSQLYAFGMVGDIPTRDVLLQHEQDSTATFDYATGTAVVTSGGDPASLRRNHGVLNIFGWGILLPVGAIIARYCRQWDPAWYYLHVGLQISGFVLIIASLVMGVQLADQLVDSNIGTHRALGIFVFVLATMQVSAVLVRPKKDAKIRRYWNFYHHWAGRLALVVAAVNIFVGIDVASGGRKWKASYGLVLVIELVLLLVLEALSWMNRMAQKEPTLQLGGGNMQPSYPTSAPPAYDNYRNDM
ncbi:hypothetical protein MPTK1_7g15400 [Marchantia polymorpha subsp. ruderalis]|uniref:Cytochrome b561 and DOMON domain-containing protein n=2 Tax=Marchantia polymorpha TaxID=3197 RepID=A0A176VJQ6_MARPO|nr:hypothetical protein AXG93_3873s1080 [Marchantia polymorpha subsp. ruderalis]PTQ47146.1 hypothetical protein MARPO_0009s0224 [Marchantia polymorpha]BBN17540.1 hypothetical protein Mp_7g15400 [Marchantia polymorpha subsp. ruderalis]|eukprot:PTQ47146.1 hypothetical protein MARPO_0009s0224 [Marchantia polymorpha]